MRNGLAVRCGGRKGDCASVDGGVNTVINRPNVNVLSKFVLEVKRLGQHSAGQASALRNLDL
jgi:hypothetical protein